MIASVDDAAAELYGGSLDGFVAARDAMAKEVRAGGDRAMAAEIKALRKPTVAADALNRAIRSDPMAVERLLDAVEALRRTQEAMLAGEPADFAADQRAYRDAVEAVAMHATTNQVEVRAAIEAAAVGGLAAQLRGGAFAVLPEPTGGFGPFAAGPGSVAGAGPGTAARPRRGRRSDRPSKHAEAGDGGGDGADRAERGPSAAERRLAERVRRAAEQTLAEAEEEHRVTSERAAVADDRVTELDGQLVELEAHLVEVRLARDEAVGARAEADAARATAAAALDDATTAWEGLEAE